MKLSSSEFDLVVSHLRRMSDTGSQAARLVLVDGKAQSEVCTQLGKSKQEVSRWVGRVLTKHAELMKLRSALDQLHPK